MKIEVDWDLCQGHANCMGDAPEVFRVDDDGKLTVLDGNQLGALLADFALARHRGSQ